jgi:hypothetical protein
VGREVSPLRVNPPLRYKAPGARTGSTAIAARVASLTVLVRAITIDGCLEPVLGGLPPLRDGLHSVLCRTRQQIRSLISSHAWTVRTSLIKAGHTLMRRGHALVHASESLSAPAHRVQSLACQVSTPLDLLCQPIRSL